MDGFAHPPKVGALFAEDFDLPEAAPEPEVIEPVFSVGEVAEVRAAAWREGQAAGLRDAAADSMASTRQTVETIVAQLTEEREAAAAHAEQVAEAIARVLLDSLAATFPVLCARHGDAEVRAVVRAVLPALTQEPAITVRAHPRTAGAVAQELERLDPDVAARVTIVAHDTMAPGDVRIAWRNGTAVRDATALWEQVAAVLVPAGLLRADASIRETIDGD